MFYKVASETFYEKKEGVGRKRRGNKGHEKELLIIKKFYFNNYSPMFIVFL